MMEATRAPDDGEPEQIEQTQEDVVKVKESAK